ncbi:MAG: CopD family protein [Gemmatimonadaceae bacterium]
MTVESLADVGRFALALGAALVIGDSVSAWAVGSRPGDRLVVPRRIHLLGAWLAVLTALLLLFVAQAVALDLAPSTAEVAMLVRQTAWGRGWSVLAGVALVGSLLALLRAPWLLRTLVAGALAVAMGGLGHSSADSAPIVARGLDAVHVLGMGGWLGALLWMYRDVAHEVTRGGWQRYSRLAGVAAPVVVLSGMGSALRRFGTATVPEILGSSYGRLLLGKVAVVGLVLALGAWHRRQLAESESPGRLSVLTELLLAAAVLGVTALLTGTAPPGE